MLTPKKKTANSTTLMMERKLVKPKSSGGNVHIAGGSNAGIVVNKESIDDGKSGLLKISTLSRNLAVD